MPELLPAPPSYVGVGSRLMGSRWWQTLLAEHPDVVVPPAIDEQASDGELRWFQAFCDHEMTDADIADYHALFRREDGQAGGEWSARYMTDPWVPPLLKRAAPDARILVMLADPIARFRLRLGEYHALADAGKVTDAAWAEFRVFMGDAVVRARYTTQLTALFDVFDREQVLVLQQERCRQDPLGQYRRTLEFLGLDASFVPDRYRRLAAGKPPLPAPIHALRRLGVPLRRPDWLKRLMGATVLPPPLDLWPDLDRVLHAELDDEMRALPELVPEIDLALWPGFAHLAPGAAT